MNSKHSRDEIITIASPDCSENSKKRNAGYEFTVTPKTRRQRNFSSRKLQPRNAVPHSARIIMATETGDILNSKGHKIFIHPLWHVELSPLTHSYLQRNQAGDLELHIKEFTEKTEKGAIYVESGVKLDIQQTRDLMFCLLQVRPTVLRNEDFKVRKTLCYSQFCS